MKTISKSIIKGKLPPVNKNKGHIYFIIGTITFSLLPILLLVLEFYLFSISHNYQDYRNLESMVIEPSITPFELFIAWIIFASCVTSFIIYKDGIQYTDLFGIIVRVMWIINTIIFFISILILIQTLVNLSHKY